MRWTDWVATAALIFILSLAYNNVHGEELSMVDKGGSLMILHDTACTSDKVLFIMKYQALPTKGLFNVSYFTVKRGTINGCYAFNPTTGQLFLLFENGLWSTQFYIQQFSPEGKAFEPYRGQPLKPSATKKQYFYDLIRSTAYDGDPRSNNHGSSESGR